MRATRWRLDRSACGWACTLPEVHRIESELGDRQGVAINLCRFAHVLAIFGQPHLAAQLIGCSDARFEEIGSDLAWVKEINDETLERARTEIDDLDRGHASD